MTYIQPEEAYRYLGAKLSPWKGYLRKDLVPKIVAIIKNVRKLKLKPWQKLELLRIYIFPKFIYELTMTLPAKGTLQLWTRQSDRRLRKSYTYRLLSQRGFFTRQSDTEDWA